MSLKRPALFDRLFRGNPGLVDDSAEELLFGGKLRYDTGFTRHDDAGPGLTFLQAARGIPRMLAVVWRWAWATDRRPLLTVVASQAGQGLAQGFGLLATNRMLMSLFAAGPTPGRLRAALPALAAVAAIGALIPLLAAVSTAAVGRLEPTVERQAASEVLRRAIRVDLAVMEDAEFHRLLDSAQYGIEAVRRVISQGVAVMSAVFAIAASGVVLAALDPVLFPLLVLIAVPKGWGAVRVARSEYRSTQAWLQHLRATRLLSGLLTDQQGAPEVRVHAVGPFLLDRFEQMSAQAGTEQARLAREKAGTEVTASAFSGLAALATYATLILLLASGSVPFAVAGTAVLGIRNGSARITDLITRANGLYRESLFIQDLQALTTLGDRHAIPRGGTPVAGSPQAIELRNVSFTYPGRTTPAVEDVSLTIEQGQVIALVGENGSGKTTLAKLIAGLYRPQSGRITWDGTDVTELDRDQLFEHIGMLTQDFQRWPFTARTNVTVGRPDHPQDQDALTRAAAYADADRIASSLPRGWDTLLARGFTGGVELSGGQWQRLGLARTRYRSAPVLICDEPTSALDPQSEIDAFNKIRRMAEHGHTVILITHRLASITRADHIYVLNEGRLIEQGTHTELLRSNGRFATMFRAQADQYAQKALSESDL